MTVAKSGPFVGWKGGLGQAWYPRPPRPSINKAYANSATLLTAQTNGLNRDVGAISETIITLNTHSCCRALRLLPHERCSSRTRRQGHW